jgi:signal transduction histidine kinase
MNNKIFRKIFFTILLLFAGYIVIFGHLFNINSKKMSQQLIKGIERIETVSIENSAQSLVEQAETNFLTLAEHIARDINIFLSEREQDLLFLAEMLNDNEIDYHKHLRDFQAAKVNTIRYNTNTDQEPVEKLEPIPLYAEISIIATSGQETIKMAGGNTINELKDVSVPANTGYKNEDYFAKTIGLERGEIYVSRVNTWYITEAEARKDVPEDLRESKRWDIVPGRDMMKTGDIKFATPLFMNGERTGVLVLSLDYRHLQGLTKHIDPARPEEAVSTSYEGNYILFYDDEGSTIVHPKPNNIRGYRENGELEHFNTVATPGGIFNLQYYDKNDSYKNIYNSTILEKQSLVTSATDVKGRTKMTISVPILYGQGEYGARGVFGGIMMSVNMDRYNESANNLQAMIQKVTEDSKTSITQLTNSLYFNLIVWTILVLLILFTGLVFFIHRIILAPLKRIERAVHEVGQGNLNSVISIKSKDEIGKLAEGFNKMVGNLNISKTAIEDHSRILEKAVKEKTRELENLLADEQQDKQELERQRKAIMNILEDVSESQNELKETYDSLRKQSKQLAALKQLGDELASVWDIEGILMIINKYFKEFVGFEVATYLVTNPTDEGGLVYTSYLKDAVSDKYIDSIEDKMFAYIGKNSSGGFKKTLKLIENIRPKYIGKHLDNSNKKMPEAVEFFPLGIGDNIIGIMQLSGSRSQKLKPEEKELIEAVASAVSMSIDRLHSLIITQHSKTVSLVESLRDGVLMFNENQEATLMNPAFSSYTGMSEDRFDITELYSLIKTKDLRQMVERALIHGNVSFIKEAVLGRKHFEVLVTPVKDNYNKIVGGAVLFHDITYLMEIDQMKTEFVSVASHQLRTPLTAIKLFTEMLLDQGGKELTDEHKEYLESIYQSTERMVLLVNDLLSLSRLESGRLKVDPRTLDLREFVQNIIDEVKQVAKAKKVNIGLSCQKDLPPISIDPNLMRQVIHNLITNAIRYTAESKDPAVEVKITKPKNDFIVSIKDNGIGIPEPVQDRIFEKFYRADNAIKANTEGTGLGLYVSKMIVESSKGKIWFESEQGKGTQFFVAIPGKGMKKKQGDKTITTYS